MSNSGSFYPLVNRLSSIGWFYSSLALTTKSIFLFATNWVLIFNLECLGQRNASSMDAALLLRRRIIPFFPPASVGVPRKIHGGVSTPFGPCSMAASLARIAYRAPFRLLPAPCSTLVSSGSVEPQPALGIVLPASNSHISDAVVALRSGQVIALPTDTLYGLACDACSAAAIARVYEIKRRNRSKSLAVCVADVGDVSQYAGTAHLPEGLLDELLPGPVTLVLPRGETSMLHPSLNPGLPSIGIRIPQNDFIRAVARSFSRALALTSANTSGEMSTVSVAEFQDLWPDCGCVFDAGTLPAVRLGSTIVDLTVPGRYKITRPGSALEPTETVLRHCGLVGASAIGER